MDKITITVSEDFINWWKTLAPHIQEDQTIMLIAYAAWQKAKGDILNNDIQL